MVLSTGKEMENCDTELYTECRVSIWLWRTIPVIQIVLGTIGNILNVIILMRKRMKRISTSVYLVCLSVTDLTTLWTLILPKMLNEGFGKNIRADSEILCQSLHWINHATGGYSVWLLVILTVERAVLTRCPIFARSKLSPRRSFVVAMVLLGITTLLSAHYIFGFKVQMVAAPNTNGTVYRPVCTFSSHGFTIFYKTIWAFTVLFVLNVIPILLVVVGNGTILITLFYQRKKFITVNPTNGQGTTRNMSERGKSSTKMIFLISACFIITTLPHTTNRVLKAKRAPSDGVNEARDITHDSILILLLYCNFTFNFLLYCLSGSLFRQELRAFFAEMFIKFRKIKQRHLNTTTDSRSVNVSIKNTTSGQSSSSRY